MNISIIGASAGIGFETVKRALDRNHSVTALSRSKIEIADNKNLVAINGSATNKADLQKAIENADAVVVALGTGKSMKATTPFVFVTGFGAGESKKYAPFPVNLMLKFMLKGVYDDKTKMEEMIGQSDMDWTIVRPGLLLDNPLTENYKIENSLYKGIKMGKISRADVADFLVKQAEQQTEVKKFVTISAN